MIADTPSLGLLIGLPIGILIAAGACLVAFLCWRSDDYDRSIGIWGGAGVCVLALIIMAAAFWPWQHDYHFWKPVNGTVEKISSRFVAADHGTNQRFVVVIKGQPYGVDDTRASLLHVGDAVHLKCKREYVWGSGDNGWGCNWNG